MAAGLSPRSRPDRSRLLVPAAQPSDKVSAINPPGVRPFASNATGGEGLLLLARVAKDDTKESLQALEWYVTGNYDRPHD
jgi:hypothetical protein